jgi:hypothetical protein
MSTWANSPFKLTTKFINISATFSYIGLDSSNPANRDIKLKILLGKKLWKLRCIKHESFERIRC